MPSTGNVKRLFNALRLYLVNLRGTTEPVISKEKLESLSINYSTIPLSRETKWVRVYFSREIINAYMKHLSVWDLYAEQVLHDRPTSEVVKQLFDYVIAWQQEKVFNDDTRTFIENAANSLSTRCSFHCGRVEKTWAWFEQVNASSDKLTEYFDAKFKEPINSFPYIRAYNYFFRKKRIDIEQVRELMAKDINALDELINMLKILDGGWDKCGKGDAFDNFRATQQCLLRCVRIVADAIEYEIHFYEHILQFNQAIINFKLFPMD